MAGARFNFLKKFIEQFNLALRNYIFSEHPQDLDRLRCLITQYPAAYLYNFFQNDNPFIQHILLYPRTFFALRKDKDKDNLGVTLLRLLQSNLDVHVITILFHIRSRQGKSLFQTAVECGSVIFKEFLTMLIRSIEPNQVGKYLLQSDIKDETILHIIARTGDVTTLSHYVEVLKNHFGESRASIILHALIRQKDANGFSPGYVESYQSATAIHPMNAYLNAMFWAKKDKIFDVFRGPLRYKEVEVWGPPSPQSRARRHCTLFALSRYQRYAEEDRLRQLRMEHLCLYSEDTNTILERNKSDSAYPRRR